MVVSISSEMLSNPTIIIGSSIYLGISLRILAIEGDCYFEPVIVLFLFPFATAELTGDYFYK